MQSEKPLHNGGAFRVIYVLKSYNFIQPVSEIRTGLRARNMVYSGLPALPICGTDIAY